MDAHTRWERRFGAPAHDTEEDEMVPLRPRPGGCRRRAARPTDQRVLLAEEVDAALELVTGAVGERAHPYLSGAKALGYGTALLVGASGGRLEHLVIVAGSDVLASQVGCDCAATFDRMSGAMLPLPPARKEVV